MEYIWKKAEPGPIDIWLHETEIEPMKEIIAIGDFTEYWLWFGNIKATDEEINIQRNKYVNKNRDRITFDRVLSFCAAGFGNKMERTITILRGSEVIE